MPMPHAVNTSGTHGDARNTTSTHNIVSEGQTMTFKCHKDILAVVAFL